MSINCDETTAKVTRIKTELLSSAKNFQTRANEYRAKGELEGSLINYLLSTENFRHYLKTINDTDTYDIQVAQDNINDNLSYIVPMQEKLKELKKNRSCNKDDDDENTLCIDISKEKIPPLDFDQISGQETAKKQIINGILNPVMYPRLFPYLSKGILFYGPPGTGKTLLAKAFVNELQQQAKKCFHQTVKVLLYAPSGGELKGKFVGETEKNIRKYFECASKQATKCQNNNLPDDIRVLSVLFLDEVEAIAGDRSKDESGMMTNSVNALLQMMDGVKTYENVIVMAATNYPWDLDAAIMRRFDTKIYVTLPNANDISNLIKIEISNYILACLKEKKTVSVPEPDEVDDTDPDAKCITEGGMSCGDGVCIEDIKMNTMTPVRVFDKYREKYFDKFTDIKIGQISETYALMNFSGGDVKNACRGVFKEMATIALKELKLIDTYLLDPEKLNDAGEPKMIKPLRLYSPYAASASTSNQDTYECVIYPLGDNNEDDASTTSNPNVWYNWEFICSLKNDNKYSKIIYDYLVSKSHTNRFSNQENEIEKIQKIVDEIFAKFNDAVRTLGNVVYVNNIKLLEFFDNILNENKSDYDIDCLCYIDVNSSKFKDKYCKKITFIGSTYAKIPITFNSETNSLTYDKVAWFRKIFKSDARKELEKLNDRLETSKSDIEEEIDTYNIGKLEACSMFEETTQIITMVAPPEPAEPAEAVVNSIQHTTTGLSVEPMMGVVDTRGYFDTDNVWVPEDSYGQTQGHLETNNDPSKHFLRNLAQGIMVDKENPKNSLYGIQIAKKAIEQTKSELNFTQLMKDSIDVFQNETLQDVESLFVKKVGEIDILSLGSGLRQVRSGGGTNTLRIKKTRQNYTKKRKRDINDQNGGFNFSRDCGNVVEDNPGDIMNISFMESDFKHVIDKVNKDHVRASISKKKLDVLDKYQGGEELTNEEKKV